MNDRNKKWKIFAVQLLIKKTRRAMARRTVLVECTPQDYVEAYNILEGIAASHKSGEELGMPLANEEALARLEDEGFSFINLEHDDDVIGVANGAVAMFNDAVATAEAGDKTAELCDAEREQNLIKVSAKATKLAIGAYFRFFGAEKEREFYAKLHGTTASSRAAFNSVLHAQLRDSFLRGELVYTDSLVLLEITGENHSWPATIVSLANEIHNTYEGIE